MDLDDALQTNDLDTIRAVIHQKKPLPKQLDRGLDWGFFPSPPGEDAIRLFVEAGATDRGLAAALRHAAGKDLLGHVEFLVKLGAPVGGHSNHNSPLQIAAKKGFVGRIARLYELGATSEWLDPKPLMLAAENRHVDAVRALIAAGEDCDELRPGNSDHRDGKHAILAAVKEGHLEVVRTLIEAGTNLAFATRKHRTPLEFARALPDRAELVALLETAGAPEVSPDMLGLEGAAHRGFGARAVALYSEASEREQRAALKHAVSSGHIEVVKALAALADPVLHLIGLGIAAENGHLAIIAHFLDLGTPINGVPERGHPALLRAASVNQLEAATLLLARGADPNIGDYRNETPLHVAAERNRLEMVKLLLNAGANLKALCNAGRTPTHVAKKYGAKDTLAYLKQRSKPRSKRKVLTDARAKLAGWERRAHKPKTSTRKKVGLTESRLGGYPALLEGEAWPVGASGEPLQFLLQLDAAILPEDVLGGSRTGLIQVFFQDRTKEHLVRVVPPSASLVAGVLPPQVEEVGPRRTITGWLKPKEDWPRAGSVPAGALDAEEREAISKLTRSGDKAGGWPFWIQDACSFTSSDGRAMDRLLLQLDAGGALPFTFGDSGIAFLLATSTEPLEVAFAWQTP